MVNDFHKTACVCFHIGLALTAALWLSGSAVVAEILDGLAKLCEGSLWA